MRVFPFDDKVEVVLGAISIGDEVEVVLGKGRMPRRPPLEDGEVGAL